MNSKLITTLSFIKNNPLAFHRYILPDVRFFNLFFKKIHCLVFLIDFFKRKVLSKKYYKTDNFNYKLGFFIFNENNFKREITPLLNQVKQITKKINWQDKIQQAKKKFLYLI